MRKSSRVTGVALLALGVLAVMLCYAAWREDRHGLLTVSFLNIGQGDSILIDAPSGNQMLIDGGPGSVVLRRLAETMPWWDRSIDVVLATHPDIDHTNGLADVFSHYSIRYIFLPSVHGATEDWATTLRIASSSGAQKLVAVRGQVIELGGGAYAEILFPDRPLPHVDTNSASAVVRLVYGNTSFLFTGDLPQGGEQYLVALDGKRLHADVLKAGHHGSKHSSSFAFIGTVRPSYIVFSRGCNNRYGHPNKETLARIAAFNIATADTCSDGTVTFISDGETVRRD